MGIEPEAAHGTFMFSCKAFPGNIQTKIVFVRQSTFVDNFLGIVSLSYQNYLYLLVIVLSAIKPLFFVLLMRREILA